MKTLNILIIILATSLIVMTGLFFGKDYLLDKRVATITAQPIQNIANNEDVVDINIKNEPSFEPPNEIKAVYVTSWSASSNNYLNYLIDLSKNTQINSAVVDIKDWSGIISYDTQVDLAEKYGAESFRIKNIDAFIQKLHDEKIYVIGRIAVFQDPILAKARPEIAIHSQSRLSFPPLDPLNPVSNLMISSISPFSLWLDRLGLAWIDPAAKDNWNYNIAIAKDALSHGFDEINFDYVRFPSDGNLKDMIFPIWDGKTEKHLIIRGFFEHLRNNLPEARLSVDLFGLSCSSTDDLGVGQVIEDAFPYFDYISPMVYPSHYAPGFLGFANPAEYPYEVINYSTTKAMERLSIFQQNQKTNQPDNQKTSPWLRPWIQDFDLGAIYDEAMVKSEIQAVYDALGTNFNGFMVWNPSNIYTENALKQK